MRFLAMATAFTGLVLGAWTGGADGARAAQRIGAGTGAPLTPGEPTAVAVSPSGPAVALVGYRHGRVTGLGIRRARAGHRFGHARLVPASRVRRGNVAPETLRVVIGAGGRALLMWTSNDESGPIPEDTTFERCCRRLWAAVVDESGRIGPAKRLSAPGGSFESVGSVRGRRAAVAWHDLHGLNVAVADARGRFSNPMRLLTTADPLLDIELLAVHLVDGHPRLVAREPSRAIVELRSTALGPVRRELGGFPWATSVGAVSASANGNLLVVGESLTQPMTLRIAHRRPGGQLHVSEVRWTDQFSEDVAATVTSDGRGIVLASARAGACKLVVIAVHADGRVDAPWCGLLSSRWIPGALAAAASSSGEAILGAFAAPDRYALHARVFAWRVGLDGRPRTRRTVVRREPRYAQLTAGIDAAGRGLLGWDVFAARVR
jgi:hypothetical protein